MSCTFFKKTFTALSLLSCALLPLLSEAQDSTEQGSSSLKTLTLGQPFSLETEGVALFIRKELKHSRGLFLFGPFEKPTRIIPSATTKGQVIIQGLKKGVFTFDVSLTLLPTPLSSSQTGDSIEHKGYSLSQANITALSYKGIALSSLPSLSWSGTYDATAGLYHSLSFNVPAFSFETEKEQMSIEQVSLKIDSKSDEVEFYTTDLLLGNFTHKTKGKGKELHFERYQLNETTSAASPSTQSYLPFFLGTPSKKKSQSVTEIAQTLTDFSSETQQNQKIDLQGFIFNNTQDDLAFSLEQSSYEKKITEGQSGSFSSNLFLKGLSLNQLETEVSIEEQQFTFHGDALSLPPLEEATNSLKEPDADLSSVLDLLQALFPKVDLNYTIKNASISGEAGSSGQFSAFSLQTQATQNTEDTNLYDLSLAINTENLSINEETLDDFSLPEAAVLLPLENKINISISDLDLTPLKEKLQKQRLGKLSSSKALSKIASTFLRSLKSTLHQATLDIEDVNIASALFALDIKGETHSWKARYPEDVDIELRIENPTGLQDFFAEVQTSEQESFRKVAGQAKLLFTLIKQLGKKENEKSLLYKLSLKENSFKLNGQNLPKGLLP